MTANQMTANQFVWFDDDDDSWAEAADAAQFGNPSVSEPVPQVRAGGLREQLVAAADELINAGWQIEAVGRRKRPAHGSGWLKRPVDDISEEARKKLAADEVSGLAVVLGERARLSNGQVPYALEFEGRACTSTKWLADWDLALDAEDATSVWTALEHGWVSSTPSGGKRWFFTTTQPLPAGACAARRDGSTFAEVLSARAIVPPSAGDTHETGLPYVRLNGTPLSVPSLDLADLTRLRRVVERCDESPGRPSPTRVDAYTAHVRRAFASVGLPAVREAATKAGWTVVTELDDGACRLARPGSRSGDAHAVLDARGFTVFTTADSNVAAGWHGFLEATAQLAFAGELRAAAEAVVAAGHVPPPPRETLGLPMLRWTDQDLETAVAKIVEAAKSALGPLGLPKAVVHNGQIVLPTPGGGVRRLRPDSGADAVMAFVSPVFTFPEPAKNNKPAKPAKFDHSVPRPLATAATTALLEACPEVDRVATEPVLTDDGRVLATTGHDVASRTVVVLSAQTQARFRTYSVPERPTVEQAQAALDLLDTELLADFPFASSGDRARALALLISACSVDLIRAPIPGFVISAPDRGSGKSLLATLARLVAFGHVSATELSPSARDDSENVKRVVSAALADSRALHIDEIPREAGLTSLFVTRLLTAPRGGMEERVLGGHASVPIGGRFVLTACGPNVHLGGDHVRRWIPIELAWSGSGSVLDRSTFRHQDILAWAAANRPLLLAAIHTIVLHGRQSTATTCHRLAGFERWSHLVLGALASVRLVEQNVAGLVLDGRAEWTAAHDDLGEQWAPLMSFWARNYGENAVSARSLLANARKTGVNLPDALIQIVGQTASGDSRRAGRALTRMGGTAVPLSGDCFARIKILRTSDGNRFALSVSGPLPTRGVSDETPPPEPLELV